MAGDWIKMRSNLWDDPRVARLCDMTDESEAAVIGGLYWLWAAADQHSENGSMPGLTIKAIDRKTGVKGLGDALVSIGWLIDEPDGVHIARFDEHNGSSAKRRSMDAQRKANIRKVSASHADTLRTESGRDVELEKEKEKEIPSLSKRGKPNEGAHENESAPATSQAGDVCRRLKRAGIADVNPSHPRLVALLQAGMTVDEIADIGPEAMTKRKGFAWILATAEGRRREAENVTPLPQRQPGGRHAPGIGNHKPSLAERATAARIEAQRLAGGGPAVEPVGADDAPVRAPLDGDFRRIGDE